MSTFFAAVFIHFVYHILSAEKQFLREKEQVIQPSSYNDVIVEEEALPNLLL